ncbi:MAG: TonB family protein [Alphaproteobacteria bacterium]|nr:MAG: TonB family protein [Alphaproteobacteria bacterium]
MMKKYVLPLLLVPVAVALFLPIGADADATTDWTNEVSKIVAAKQGYPRLAIARQIEGKAKVRLTVAADGTITNYEIVEPTGEEVLDQTIPKLIGKINPLPPLPDGQKEVTFILPLSWSIN